MLRVSTTASSDSLKACLRYRKKRNHHAQRYAGTACARNTASDDRCFAEQVQIVHGHGRPGFAHEEVGDSSFDLLPAADTKNLSVNNVYVQFDFA